MLRATVVCTVMVVAQLALALDEPPRTKWYRGDGIALRLPEDAIVTKKTPVQDFNIYTVTYQKKTLLRVYEGNAPSFPTDAFTKREADKGERQEKLGVVVRSVQKVTKGGYSREVLVDISAKSKAPGWPVFFHLWYRGCQGNLEMSHREQLRNVILVTFLRARWGSCV
jgi:hypothetical protein